MAGPDDINYLDEFADLERVETRIQLIREDYRTLTNRIDHYSSERSRLEAELRSLKGLASRIKAMREDEDI